jgi:hypothetical protein
MNTDTTAASQVGPILGELYDSLDDEGKELMAGIFSREEAK